MLQEFVIACDMQNIHKNIEVAFLYYSKKMLPLIKVSTMQNNKIVSLS